LTADADIKTPDNTTQNKKSLVKVEVWVKVKLKNVSVKESEKQLNIINKKTNNYLERALPFRSRMENAFHIPLCLKRHLPNGEKNIAELNRQSRNHFRCRAKFTINCT
jgi:hypothetical protein